MASLEQLLQKYVNMSYDDLLACAKYSLPIFISDLVKESGQKEAASFLAVLIAVCLGTDANFTALENKFFNDLIGTNDSYADNLKLVQALNTDKSRKLVENSVHRLPADKKSAVVSFCLCILAVDETISKDETAFINRLIG